MFGRTGFALDFEEEFFAGFDEAVEFLLEGFVVRFGLEGESYAVDLGVDFYELGGNSHGRDYSKAEIIVQRSGVGRGVELVELEPVPFEGFGEVQQLFGGRGFDDVGICAETISFF